MFKGLENVPSEERLQELDLSSLEKAQRGHHHVINLYKVWLQSGQRLYVHKEPHR